MVESKCTDLRASNHPDIITLESQRCKNYLQKRDDYQESKDDDKHQSHNIVGTRFEFCQIEFQTEQIGIIDAQL